MVTLTEGMARVGVELFPELLFGILDRADRPFPEDNCCVPSVRDCRVDDKDGCTPPSSAFAQVPSAHPLVMEPESRSVGFGREGVTNAMNGGSERLSRRLRQK